MLRVVVRLLLMVVGIGISVGCFVNVYGDDTDVRSQAELLACGKGGCTKPITVSVSRTPFWETVAYLSSTGTVTVHCERAAVFLGPYSCEKE
jgi:hypothetical protein